VIAAIFAPRQVHVAPLPGNPSTSTTRPQTLTRWDRGSLLHIAFYVDYYLLHGYCFLRTRYNQQQPNPKRATRTQTAPLGPARISIVTAQVGISILESSSSPLLDGSTFSDTGASMSMKQLAAPPVQERLAPVRGRFLNFVEQRTWIVPLSPLLKHP
jgi:hypothetical protein